MSGTVYIVVAILFSGSDNLPTSSVMLPKALVLLLVDILIDLGNSQAFKHCVLRCFRSLK